MRPQILALGVLPALACALVLAGCGGGETTVTVTETVPPGQSGQQGAQGGDPGEIVGKGVVTGYVDNAAVEDGGTLVLNGWAASRDLSEAASRVAAQVGGRTVAGAVPAIEREDVVEALGEPGVAESGFELRLPLESLECDAPAAGVRVVGSLDGRSSPLTFGEGIKAAIADAC